MSDYVIRDAVILINLVCEKSSNPNPNYFNYWYSDDVHSQISEYSIINSQGEYSPKEY